MHISICLVSLLVFKGIRHILKFAFGCLLFHNPQIVCVVQEKPSFHLKFSSPIRVFFKFVDPPGYEYFRDQ